MYDASAQGIGERISDKCTLLLTPEMNLYRVKIFLWSKLFQSTMKRANSPGQAYPVWRSRLEYHPLSRRSFQKDSVLEKKADFFLLIGYHK